MNVWFPQSAKALGPLQSLSPQIVASFIATGMSSIYDEQGYNLSHNHQGPFRQYVSREAGSVRLRVSHDDEARARLLREQNPNNLKTFTVVHRDALGYPLHTFPVILAICVLFFYCTYVLIFVVFSLYDQRSLKSWNPFTDVTALALNSKPPSHLGAIYGGIDTLKTFQEPVSILANEKNSLDKGLKLSSDQVT